MWSVRSTTGRGYHGDDENLDKLRAAVQEYAVRAGESMPFKDGQPVVRRMRAWSESSQEVFVRWRGAALDMLSHQQRRMIGAFPRLSSTTSDTYNALIETVRNLLKHTK